MTCDGPGVLRLEALVAALEQSGARLVAALTSASEEELARETMVNGRQRTVADGVFGLYFHETWHAGQTELLRQLAGRGDKVI